MKIEKIKKVIDEHYHPSQYPALYEQIELWRKSRPLEGIKILDATPVFRNTMIKYLALLSAGAELSVGILKGITSDPLIIKFLSEIDIPVISYTDQPFALDVVSDCAGEYSNFNVTLGSVELTRSGVHVYQSKQNCQPVFVADAGRIKQIETTLGTGESLYRALNQLGYTNLKGKKMVLFGSGKVGKGIIAYANLNGCYIDVITDTKISGSTTDFIASSIVDCRDKAEIEHLILQADLVVSATGIENIIEQTIDINILKNNSSTLLINMGAEDEFGPSIPKERVLNNKVALNFILEEPTHLKYIDATLALANEGILYLKQHHSLHSGCFNPPTEIEDRILATTYRNGVIKQEIRALGI